jgi:hypothetical protein
MSGENSYYMTFFLSTGSGSDQEIGLLQLIDNLRSFHSVHTITLIPSILYVNIIIYLRSLGNSREILNIIWQ